MAKNNSNIPPRTGEPAMDKPYTTGCKVEKITMNPDLCANVDKQGFGFVNSKDCKDIHDTLRHFLLNYNKTDFLRCLIRRQQFFVNDETVSVENVIDIKHFHDILQKNSDVNIRTLRFAETIIRLRNSSTVASYIDNIINLLTRNGYIFQVMCSVLQKSCIIITSDGVQRYQYRTQGQPNNEYEIIAYDDGNFYALVQKEDLSVPLIVSRATYSRLEESYLPQWVQKLKPMECYGNVDTIMQSDMLTILILNCNYDSSASGSAQLALHQPGKDIGYMVDFASSQYSILLVYQDQRADDVRAVFGALQNGSKSDRPSFRQLVVVVVSHGMFGYICGSDTKPVSIDDLTSMFSKLDDDCKYLVIDACRKKRRNKYGDVADGRSDDTIICYTTQPYQVAIYEQSGGSLFLQCLSRAARLCAVSTLMDAVLHKAFFLLGKKQILYNKHAGTYTILPDGDAEDHLNYTDDLEIKRQFGELKYYG